MLRWWMMVDNGVRMMIWLSLLLGVGCWVLGVGCGWVLGERRFLGGGVWEMCCGDRIVV